MTTAHDPDRVAALIEKWRAEADVSDALVDAGEITPQVAEHERGTAFASRLCADELEAVLAVPACPTCGSPDKLNDAYLRPALLCKDEWHRQSAPVAPSDSGEPRASAVTVAAKALVDKLDEVHASPAMQSVWVMNHIHGGRYDGPNYAEELKALRAALESDSATQALASAGETQDSIMLAVKTERAVIADYIEACREDRRVVQVFDVLAKHIREGKHYPDLPTAPDPGSALASAGELPASLARNYQQATAEERAMARGFVTLWESVGVQDAEDWLYTLRNRAELLASLDEDDCRDAVLAALTADELEAALAVPVLASSSVVTLSKWLRHDEVCPTRNNPKAVLACSCGLNDAVLATLSATHALASAGELPASLARQEQG